MTVRFAVFDCEGGVAENLAKRGRVLADVLVPDCREGSRPVAQPHIQLLS